MQVFLYSALAPRRLPPLTETLPVPLLPVLDRPVLEVAVELIARAGLKAALVAVPQSDGQIAAQFHDGRRWGLQLDYAPLGSPSGDAAALKWVEQRIQRTVLGLPADAIIDLDLPQLLAAHQASGALLTLVVAPPRIAASALPSLPHGQFTGAYLAEPALLAAIPNQRSFQLVADLLPQLAAGQVGYLVHSGYWNPLESFADLHQAQQVFLYSAYANDQAPPEALQNGPPERVRYPSPPGRRLAHGIWVGHNYAVHPTVKVAAPVFLGAASWVGREAEIGPGAVIGSHVMIDDEATVRRSMVFGGTYVGQLLRADNLIVTSSAIIDPAADISTPIVDPFLLAPTAAPEMDLNAGTQQAANRVLGAILLLLLSPLLALGGLLALAGGQPLVRLVRLGRRRPDGQIERFLLLNWRTHRADGRPTLFGAWLAARELQRLPELLNVVRGELDLVGVSPLAPDEAAGLTEEWQQRRFERRPGFTGRWYVEGHQERDAMLVADVYYVATRNLREDLNLLWQTPGAWHLRRGQTPRHDAIIAK